MTIWRCSRSAGARTSWIEPVSRSTRWRPYCRLTRESKSGVAAARSPSVTVKPEQVRFPHARGQRIDIGRAKSLDRGDQRLRRAKR